MRGSSLTTFLMFLPLIAIPLLAIFGVPEFSPGKTAATSPGGPNAIPIDQRTAPVSTALTSAGSRSKDRIFAPPDAEKTTAAAFPSNVSNPDGDPFLAKGNTQRSPARSAKAGLNGWALGQQRQPETNRKTIETPHEDGIGNSVAGPSRNPGMQSVPSTPEPASSSFTWGTAVRALNRMGIRDFLLQPGSRANEFHFSCLLNTADNPRIVHRYEAEDADPLRAVQKVLAQIEKRR